MAKFLGLDLGTNSIGWSIRETDVENRKSFYNDFQNDKYEKLNKYSITNEINLTNEIVDYGVLIFKKGVGDGKSGEFSLSAERRKNRSKRRLYNAKRYRKWELLKVLIENGMCPLTEIELRLWSIGNWKEINWKWKNLGRVYPISNESFQQWLAFEPAIFGDKGISENDKQIRKNPYDLRCELIENEEENDYLRKLKIGRALYHLVQRRGFKSSRKSGQSGYAKNEDIEKIKLENPDFQIVTLAKEKLDKGERFRASGVIKRRYFEEEFFSICNTQKLSKELTEKLYKAIYFVRPLRSQKGLVGNCTLERTISVTDKNNEQKFVNKGKPRIPISHPKFEEFRALQFINNIKWREKDSKEFVEIPISLKKRIFEELFFRRLTSGKNKGKVNDDNYFKFDEIIKSYSENGTYEFNYKNLPNVSTCPTIAVLMNVFDNDWTEKFIRNEDTYGINWNGLIIKYKTQDYKKLGRRLKRKIVKGKVTYTTAPLNKEKTLTIDEIWHLLFDYLQTKDKQEEFKKFCKEVLSFNEDKAQAFSDINIPQGYGSLSYKAISKILPFLQSGYIYSEAVLFANLKKVLGNQFEEKKEEAKKLIAKVIKETGQKKEKLNIVNGLIQKYFAEAETNHAKGADDTIKELAWQETLDRLKNYFGEADWNKKPEVVREKLTQEIFDLYLKFLNGEQTKEEKASAKDNRTPEIDFYKLPRLDEAIKRNLKNRYNVSDSILKYLYHPSDIEMYPISKTEFENTGIKLLESPQPPSKSWKNPMAMRTLHELRHLLNYLLKIGKIDKDTKIIVEMARELNDANKRKAIEAWQNDKKKENQEYATAMSELFDIKSPSDDDYNKFKAAVEQLIEHEKSVEFIKKYTEFIDTFLIKKSKKDKGKPEETENEIEEIQTDYLMYLILNRDEFIKLLLDQPAGVGKILNLNKDFKNKRNSIKSMLTKYRLWTEQKYQCYYTGQHIPFNELFSPNYQIEHTIPRSISFDNELRNLTVCDAVYNDQVKNNKFPTECPNYYGSAICTTVKGQILCSPIKERVEIMIKPKVDELTKRIKNLAIASKKIRSWEIDKKNSNIRLKHYLQFELEYWEKKLLTFTVERNEWKDIWKNSQLVDTQIISKYARAYLKTIFEKVDVQKGTVTDIFKKIYQIKGDEQKDRSKHSHHALDAGILTLIPGSAKREDILEKYYQAEEKKEPKFHTKPYEDFHASHIHDIEDNVIINHVPHDKTLTATIKNIRNRGEKTGKVAQGDSIRGQLHKETFFGAVKALERNEQGFPIKENGKYKVLKNKNGEDEIWIVSRKLIKDINIDKDIIVDESLKQHIRKQLDKEIPLSAVLDFNNKHIRHIRVRVKAGVGFLSNEKAIPIKKQTYLSKHNHKNEYLVQNEENYLFMLYEGINDKKKIIRHYRILNLFDIAQLKIKNIKELKNEPEFQTITKGGLTLKLKVILKAGDRVIFFKESRDEITTENVKSKMYAIYKFNELGENTAYLYLQHHMEARPDNELEKGEKVFDPSRYQSRLEFTADKMNCLFENIDFEIKPDGTIIFNK